MHRALLVLAIAGCARGEGDPPPRASGGATVAAEELPVWFGRASAVPVRIGGRVVDEGGKPLQHARVYLRIAAPDPTVWGREETTDANGEFDFGPRRAGAYRLIAVAPGRQTRVVEVEGADAIDVPLFAYRCTPVERVVRAQRRPLEGAAIDLAGVALATTDRRGRFATCGDDPVTVRARGYGAVTSAAATIEVEPAAELEGDVTGRDDKRKADVAVQPIGTDGIALPVQARTDLAGRFTLRDVPASGTYTFRILDGMERFTDRTTVHVAGREEVAHVMLAYATPDARPAPRFAIAGTIVHAGRPVIDAEVRIGDHATRTRLDGSYALAHDQPEDAVLQVAHASGLRTSRAVAREASAITIELADVGAISGSVANASATARVRLAARTTAVTREVTVGRDGHFALAGIEHDETYDLDVADGLRHVHVEVALGAGQPNVTGLALVLP